MAMSPEGKSLLAAAAGVVGMVLFAKVIDGTEFDKPLDALADGETPSPRRAWHRRHVEKAFRNYDAHLYNTKAWLTEENITGKPSCEDAASGLSAAEFYGGVTVGRMETGGTRRDSEALKRQISAELMDVTSIFMAVCPAEFPKFKKPRRTLNG